MAAPTIKEAHALTAFYIKRYEEAYGRKPDINIWQARWGWDSVLRGMSSKDAQDLIVYYFRTPSERLHDLDWFFNNYHKLSRNMKEQHEDHERTLRLMAESQERAEAWRLSGKRGIGDQR